MYGNKEVVSLIDNCQYSHEDIQRKSGLEKRGRPAIRKGKNTFTQPDACHVKKLNGVSAEKRYSV